jgi:hypothetical protein
LFFLSIKATDDYAHKDIEEEEGPHNHKYNEEYNPIRVSPLNPNIVNLSSLSSIIHEI